MADLVAVRAAIAAQVAANALPDLSTSAELLDTINPPMFLVAPAKPVTKVDVCLGAGLLDNLGEPITPTEFNIQGVLVIARADTVSNVQDNLDQWLGYERSEETVSIAMAIDMDPTLGGLVEWCIPTVIDSYGPIEWSGVMYFGARMNLNISMR